MKKYLYVFFAPTYGTKQFVKVGISDDPNKRLIQVRSSHDHLMSIFSVYTAPNVEKIEATVKSKYKKLRWIGTECFTMMAQDMDDFILTLEGVKHVEI